MKNFHGENFTGEFNQQQWSDMNLCNEPNEMWARWKRMLLNCIDQHAPQSTQIEKNWEKEISLNKQPIETKSASGRCFEKESQTDWRLLGNYKVIDELSHRNIVLVIRPYLLQLAKKQ